LYINENIIFYFSIFDILINKRINDVFRYYIIFVGKFQIGPFILIGLKLFLILRNLMQSDSFC